MLKWISDKLNGNGDQSSPTIIGAGCTFIGNISTDHTVHIQGNFEGNITADAVVVGKMGIVRGKINADSVFIYGDVSGTTITGAAHIFGGAHVSGDLQYFSLNIVNNDGVECRLVRRRKK